MKNGLTGAYIEDVLGALPVRDFRGVYSIDTIPSLTPGSCIIFNLSRAYEEGTHFVAVYLTDTTLYYFDSFGIITYIGYPPLQLELRRLTDYYDVRLEFVTREPIQAVDSYFCGYYCIYFVLIYDEYSPPGFRPHKFQADMTYENDVILINNVIAWIEASK
jgi:hypothetical protein